MKLETLTKALTLLNKHKEESRMTPEEIARIGNLFIDTYKRNHS